jgi:hypothetical protein
MVMVLPLGGGLRLYLDRGTFSVHFPAHGSGDWAQANVPATAIDANAVAMERLDI